MMIYNHPKWYEDFRQALTDVRTDSISTAGTAKTTIHQRDGLIRYKIGKTDANK